MSRVFTKNASNFVTLGVGAVGPVINGASKVAVHCFAKATSLTTGVNDNRLLTTFVGALSGLLLEIDGSSTPQALRVGARSQAADALQVKTGAIPFGLGIWRSCGTLIDYGGALIYPVVDGIVQPPGSATFGASTYTDTGVGRVSSDAIGGAGAGSTTTSHDGPITQLAIWSFPVNSPGMSEYDWKRLARGVTATRVQRPFLVAYLALAAQSTGTSNIRDDIGALSGTVSGYIPSAEEPVFSQLYDFPPYLFGPSANPRGFAAIF